MFVVFDLETTGFDSNYCDVIQFAYTLFNDNGTFIKAESLYFYYEGMSWSEEAYNVHHISQEFLKQHKDLFTQNIIKMFAILNRAKVCGHNAKSFDCTFANNWLHRMGLPEIVFNQIEDTMLMFKSITKRSRIKLTKLQEVMKIPDDAVNRLRDIWFHNGDTTKSMSAHNAEWDVALTAILTLQGIDKGFCNFDPMAKPKDVEPIDMDTMSFEDTVFGLDDTFYCQVLPEDKYLAVNLNKGKIEEVSKDAFDNIRDLIEKKYQRLPVQFRKTDHPSFKLDSGSCKNVWGASSVLKGTPTDFYLFDDKDNGPEFYIVQGSIPTQFTSAVNWPAFIKNTWY